MIHCPYCGTRLVETSPACPNCNLSLKRANAVMGPVPPLSGTGFTALVHPVAPSGQKTILHRLKAFRRRFPQCHPHVLLCSFPGNFPPSTYLFWIFNAGGLPEAERVAGRNRDLLIGIDPDRQTAGIIVGYGLEPFLSQRDLDLVLAEAVPLLREGDLINGTITLLDGLDRLMTGICRELPSTLGLPEKAPAETTARDF